ncbi:MbnP family protein [Flavihumibacter profundi]|jgi:hypothetical protein|uniref:MbnP family protein n=1 Tax=Flavihumibacter profundi TaxID=2716883 RepID=UPI001CC6B767|nr:MbnP family protein [Flavihumibacter profundi]MBZ5858492.1 hypothetical protein [Flavihumibacter profundi]
MKKTYILLMVGLGFFSACQKEASVESPPTAHLEVRIHPEINGEPLQLNVPYTNGFGESFTVTTIKFYTGQFSLGDQLSGSSELSAGEPYFLSDLSTPSTLSFSTPIKPGTYNQLSFLIGVDSARNVSGVQSGALDPANGMFWTWNSGYIYLKMEGNSPVSNQPNGKFEYHIGGFQSPNSSIRLFIANLSAPDQWELAKGKTISFDIVYSLDNFFNSSFPLRISETPVCTTPGELSSAIANNIAAAFQVTNFEIK